RLPAGREPFLARRAPASAAAAGDGGHRGGACGRGTPTQSTSHLSTLSSPSGPPALVPVGSFLRLGARRRRLSGIIAAAVRFHLIVMAADPDDIRGVANGWLPSVVRVVVLVEWSSGRVVEWSSGRVVEWSSG